MAKGDVMMKFDADTAAAVQEFLKSRRAVEQTADAVRQFGETAHAAGDKAQKAFDQMGESSQKLGEKTTVAAHGMAALTVGAAAAAAGIKLAMEITDQYYDRLEQRGRDALAKTLTLDQAMAAAGQSAAIPGMRHLIENQTKSGEALIDKDKSTQMLAQIIGTVGDKLGSRGPEEEWHALQAAELAMAGGLSQQSATNVGINMANFARERKPGGGFENYTTDQLADLAYNATLRNNGQPLDDQQLRFFSRMTDKAEALKVLAAGGQVDEGPKVLTSIEKEAWEHIDATTIAKLEAEKRKLGAKFPAEEQRILNLSHFAEGQTRFNAMMTNPSLLNPEDRVIGQNLAEGMTRIPDAVGLQEAVRRYRSNADRFSRAAMDQADQDAVKSNYDKSAENIERNVRIATAEQKIVQAYPWVPDVVAESDAKRQVRWGWGSMFPGATQDPAHIATSAHTEQMYEKSDAPWLGKPRPAPPAPTPHAPDVISVMVQKLETMIDQNKTLHYLFNHNNKLTAEQTQVIQGSNTNLDKNPLGYAGRQ